MTLQPLKITNPEDRYVIQLKLNQKFTIEFPGECIGVKYDERYLGADTIKGTDNKFIVMFGHNWKWSHLPTNSAKLFLGNIIIQYKNAGQIKTTTCSVVMADPESRSMARAIDVVCPSQDIVFIRAKDQAWLRFVMDVEWTINIIHSAYANITKTPHAKIVNPVYSFLKGNDPPNTDPEWHYWFILKKNDGKGVQNAGKIIFTKPDGKTKEIVVLIDYGDTSKKTAAMADNRYGFPPYHQHHQRFRGDGDDYYGGDYGVVTYPKKKRIVEIKEIDHSNDLAFGCKTELSDPDMPPPVSATTTHVTYGKHDVVMGGD